MKPSKGSIWDAIYLATEVGLPELFGAHISVSCALDARHGLQDLMFSFLDFDLALVLAFAAFHSFGMSIFILCHRTLEICNLFLILIVVHS